MITKTYISVSAIVYTHPNSQPPANYSCFPLPPPTPEDSELSNGLIIIIIIIHCHNIIITTAFVIIFLPTNSDDASRSRYKYVQLPVDYNIDTRFPDLTATPQVATCVILMR